MSGLLIIGLTWTLLAVPASLIIGRALRPIRRAELADAWTDEVENFLQSQPGARAAG